MNSYKLKKTRQRRKFRAKKKLFGTPERPRLTVFRSNRGIYAQIVDDMAGVTLASAGTTSKSVREDLENKSLADKNAAELVGASIAKQALDTGIRCVCFDRGRFKYHGRIKALADAARKTGLVF